jgi:UBA-like domain
MDPNERMRTMLTLMGGDDSTIPRDPPVNPNYHRMENTVAPVPHQPPAQLDGHMDAMDTPAENPNLGLDSAQMDEHVASYCSITGSDPESARHLLEVRNGTPFYEKLQKVSCFKFLM